MALLTVAELKAALGIGDLYADTIVEQVVDTAVDVVSAYLPADVITAEPPAVREAVLAIAVDVWQSRLAPGGQMQAVDYTPSPFRMGRSLLQKVAGLLAPYTDTGGMVG